MQTKLLSQKASRRRSSDRKSRRQVFVYLRDLIDQNVTESEGSNGLGSQERVPMLREWASVHSTNSPLLSADAISRENIYGERG
jgi:hypothetical protein